MKNRKIIAVLYLACSVYSWGTTMAHFNYLDAHEWPTLHDTPRSNCGIAALIALAGPIGLVASALVTNFNEHGWTLWSGNTETQR